MVRVWGRAPSSSQEITMCSTGGPSAAGTRIERISRITYLICGIVALRGAARGVAAGQVLEGRLHLAQGPPDDAELDHQQGEDAKIPNLLHGPPGQPGGPGPGAQPPRGPDRSGTRRRGNQGARTSGGYPRSSGGTGGWAARGAHGLGSWSSSSCWRVAPEVILRD